MNEVPLTLTHVGPGVAVAGHTPAAEPSVLVDADHVVPGAAVLIGQALVDVTLAARAFPARLAGARAVDLVAGLSIGGARALLSAVDAVQVGGTLCSRGTDLFIYLFIYLYHAYNYSPVNRTGSP